MGQRKISWTTKTFAHICPKLHFNKKWLIVKWDLIYTELIVQWFFLGYFNIYLRCPISAETCCKQIPHTYNKHHPICYWRCLFLVIIIIIIIITTVLTKSRYLYFVTFKLSNILAIFLQFFCDPWEWLLSRNTSDPKQPFCLKSVPCRFYRFIHRVQPLRCCI
jgi:hypothetical protein